MIEDEIKTTKKDFVNKVDPHGLKRLIQKERCIWFGVHDDLLRNKNIIKLIQKCKDTSIPFESAAIHLDKFKAAFNKNRIFIKYDENSVIYFKLYLISKDQFLEILKIHYNCEDKIFEQKENIFSMHEINKEFDLTNFQKNKTFFNIIKCVGDLDNINIFTVTSKESEISPPDNDYLRTIFNGLKKSFHPYSEYMIMYYMYLIDGVKNFFTMKQLEEIFLHNKPSGATGTDHTAASSETNMTIGEVANQNQLLGIPPSEFNVNAVKNAKEKDPLENLDINLTPKPNEEKKPETDTIKCSTCNGSPFVTTAEKDIINQYSFIFDLHHMPNFDETTGEFYWKNVDNNWKLTHDSLLKSGDISAKSMNMFHGSLVSYSGDFDEQNNNNIPQNSDKKEDKLNNSGTFMEELDNILKEIN